MATLVLGCSQAAIAVTGDGTSGRVVTHMSGAKLHLTPWEADQLALELQRKAQQLRISAASAKQYTEALSGKADAAGTISAHTRNITVTADGGSSMSLTQVEARQLAESLVDAAAAIEEGATDCVQIDQRRRQPRPQGAAA